MNKNKTNLNEELGRIVLNSAKKREMLLQSAHMRSKTKKNLSILSGSLSLLSAGAITAVLVKYFGNTGIQIIAALTAGVSGFISLVITGYFKEDETSKIFIGSSKYLALRDKAYRLIFHPNITNEELYKVLSELQTEYAELDKLYSQFFKLFQHKERTNHNHYSSQPPVLPLKFRRNHRANLAVENAVDIEISNLRDIMT